MTTRPPVIRLYEDEAIVDNFAGGGGASTGIEMALGRSPDVAINHNEEALAMHKANHPTTHHIPDDVFRVNPVKALKGRRCGLAWFSPDCTYFSKAKGGAPFRDPRQARKVRGLIGVVLKWAANPVTRPRVVIIENVEEIEFWCPLGADGRPDPEKRGQSFRRWVSRVKSLGGRIEWRKLRGHEYGAPTIRQRLFIIIRFDGLPIVWPQPTHGPRASKPVRTAAECIDFSLPVPSIFLTPAEAKEWALAHGLPTPKRPLAAATLRRVARGVFRYVLDCPEPFIVNVRHQGGDRVHSLGEPMRTIPASDRETALVQPTFAPFLTEHANASAERTFRVDDPLRTICATPKGGHFAVVQPLLLPFMVNTRNGERHGRHGEQAPRVLDIQQPFNTITAVGSQGALVAAFLAKHHGGHEGTGGQVLTRPTDTITCRENKALVTSHLLKFYGTCQDGAPVTEGMPSITAHGNHIAEVRAFLIKYYGNEKDGRSLWAPLDTVVTKDRFALVIVTIGGEPYVLIDIGMRMLSPRELFLAQGFPSSYVIDRGIDVRTGASMRFTKKTQTRLVGNSVVPHLAAALVRANFSEAVA